MAAFRRTALAVGREVCCEGRSPVWLARRCRNTAPASLLTHRPTELDKKLLVLANLYPDIQSVPKEIPEKTMGIVRGKFQLKAAIAAFVACFVSAGFYIYLGKQERKNRNTASKGIIEDHQEYFERLNKNIVREYLGVDVQKKDGVDT